MGGEVAPDQIESKDGITPPMRNARERHFKKIPQVDPKARAIMNNRIRTQD